MGGSWAGLTEKDEFGQRAGGLCATGATVDVDQASAFTRFTFIGV